MAPKPGDKALVHYHGTLADGSTFDSSEDREPLEFEIGADQVIPGFDAAVAGLEVGESVTVTIPAVEAYGLRVEEGIQTVPRTFFGDDTPEVGWVAQLVAPDGTPMMATVTEVTDETVGLDFNHPLAGQDLTFKIELVEIVEG